MIIKVTIKDDETIIFEWDENDPADSVLNTWTEQDFMNAILNYCKETIGEEEEYNKILDRFSVTLEDNTCAETGEEPKV